ncbi:MAG: rod shape-determining protein MreC [Gemmatimonadota bacterium]|nr:rod shape-determining protein MreC [Gemmatimonadota bacterium]
MVRNSLLRPFVATQDRISATRIRVRRVEQLQDQLDAAWSRLSTLEGLEDENRTLRGLLSLSRRAGPTFRASSALRPGTPGSESLFFVDVGTDDGVREGAPVVDRHGLLGVIREVRGSSAVGMDWTHPDFRASAMLADGSMYGMVESRRGLFREVDRLVLNGTPYYEDVPAGTLVLTSGLGGVFPRGIPVGRIESVAVEEGQWLKSYFLEALVDPGSATHVLVGVEGDTLTRMEDLWPPDSVASRRESILEEHDLGERVRILDDSIAVLVERLGERGGRP